MAKPSGFGPGFGPGYGVGKYRYVLTPYFWDTSPPPRPCWNLPSSVVGGVDLRPLPAQATAGGTPTGFAFAASLQPLTGVELANVLHMNECPITTPMRDAWQGAMGFRPPSGNNLVDMLWEQLTLGSDPTGASGPKPLLPNKYGILRLVVPGHSTVRSEPFRWGEHPHTDKVRDSLRKDFEGMWEDTNGDDHCRRVLDFHCERYGVRDWEEFVPTRLHPHVPGRLPHRTTITESFNTADSDTLGPDQTWTEVVGDTDVASNKASANGSHAARCNTPLSSDNHYVQAKVGTDASGNGYPSIRCRYDNVDNTHYYADSYFAEDAVFYGKTIVGVSTGFGNSPQTLNVGTEYTLKVQSDGSTVSVHLNGSEILSTTDTAITGYVRGGIGGFKGGAGFNTWDDFQAADLQPDPSRILWRRTVRPAPFFPGIGR